MIKIISILIIILFPFTVFGQRDWESDQKLFRKRAVENYKNFDPGDIVNIYLEVDTVFENEAYGSIISTTTLSNDPEDIWTFDPLKDVKIESVLVQKSISEDTTSVVFLIKVTKLINARQITGFWGHVGDTIATDILYLKLEKQ